MKYFFLTLIGIFFTFTFLGNKPVQKTIEGKSDEWIYLWNGKDLEGWDTYLGMPYKEGMDFWNQKALPNFEPYGLNNDPRGVFSVVTKDGAPALRISGEVFGGISTVKEYKDYHLQVEFKWGDERHAPRNMDRRDSGILYHGKGEQGIEAGFWLRSQEFQIQEHDCGDYWGVAGGQMDIKTTQIDDENYQYDPNGELRTFGEESELGRHVIKGLDNENPIGQWNTIDLYCFGDKSIHMINGKVNMVLENSTLKIGDIDEKLVDGKIQLQSEGAEIFYRNIRLQPITELPKNILP